MYSSAFRIVIYSAVSGFAAEPRIAAQKLAERPGQQVIWTTVALLAAISARNPLRARRRMAARFFGALGCACQPGRLAY